MSINRKSVVYIGIAMALAVTGLVLLSCLNPFTVAPMAVVELRITDVQFDNNYLNITVENVGTDSTIISEVIINQTSTPHTVTVHEPVSPGETITIRIGFKWTSGCTYQITLKTADNANWNHPATSIAVAP